ncbi:MAG: antibiotic biosynthesis monooxygenase, partial [Bacteroidales bacterium]|nr:antibiotic biosynthesis monooxygenase [Bacteroidales bacterium]
INSMQKFITAQFFIKPEYVEKFKSLTSELIKNTRKEEGNVFYQLYQSVENPNDFIFYEIFKDQESLDAHSNAAYFEEFLKSIEGFSTQETIIKVIA